MGRFGRYLFTTSAHVPLNSGTDESNEMARQMESLEQAG
jgi:hypothetical protein